MAIQGIADEDLSLKGSENYITTQPIDINQINFEDNSGSEQDQEIKSE